MTARPGAKVTRNSRERMSEDGRREAHEAERDGGSTEASHAIFTCGGARPHVSQSLTQLPDKERAGEYIKAWRERRRGYIYTYRPNTYTYQVTNKTRPYKLLFTRDLASTRFSKSTSLFRFFPEPGRALSNCFQPRLACGALICTLHG